MKSLILFLLLYSIVFQSCGPSFSVSKEFKSLPYITQELIQSYNITTDDLMKLQYYSEGKIYINIKKTSETINKEINSDSVYKKIIISNDEIEILPATPCIPVRVYFEDSYDKRKYIHIVADFGNGINVDYKITHREARYNSNVNPCNEVEQVTLNGVPVEFKDYTRGESVRHDYEYHPSGLRVDLSNYTEVSERNKKTIVPGKKRVK